MPRTKLSRRFSDLAQRAPDRAGTIVWATAAALTAAADGIETGRSRGKPVDPQSVIDMLRAYVDAIVEEHSGSAGAEVH